MWWKRHKLHCLVLLLVLSALCAAYFLDANSWRVETDTALQATEAQPSSLTTAGEHNAKTCTISVSCATIMQNMDALDPSKVSLVPKNGMLLNVENMAFQEGETVFDVLLRACRQNGVHMEFSDTPLYGSAYIKGIGNLYEFDVGTLSGWMYRVNGVFPNIGCSKYLLSDGDRIEFMYTCDLGADIGGGGVKQYAP